ncbi:MAG: WGR domain-containing protein [Myxococcales bacterium]|nr:WGR domain-containing protein [Myxococcales bacterium]
MQKRYFEFDDGKSSKFWEVSVDGKTHTVRYGKIGTAGQEKTKSFASPEAAEKDANKLVAEKTKKGYAEVVVDSAPKASLDGAALEEQLAALERDPSPDAYLVFADWLQSKGHPWGTLIALHHGIATAPNASKRGELEKEERALLQESGVEVLGELARAARPTRFNFSYGFLTDAIIASPAEKIVLAERLKVLFALPAARRLTKLTLHAQPARFAPHRDWDTSIEDIIDPWPETLDALAGAPAGLKHLFFGDPPPTAAAAYVKLPSFAKLASVLPKLETIEAQGTSRGELERLSFPELKSLTLRFAETEPSDLDTVAKSPLPKLERLTVGLGGYSYCTLDDLYDPYENAGDDYEASYPASYPATDLEKMEVYDHNANVDATHVRAFLDAAWPSSLVHLGLQSAQLDDAMLSAIAEGALVAKLETLDLSGGTLNEAGAQALVRMRDRFAHLKTLDLSRNVLSEAAIRGLKEALPNAKCDKQRGEAVPEFILRYVATME